MSVLSTSEQTKAKFRAHTRTIRRLQEIHKAVASGTYPSVGRLADVLEVNQRTIKRDIAFLRDSMCAPIRYSRERLGYYYTGKGWSLPLQRLSEGELLAFFVAENALKLIGQSEQADKLAKALSKLVVLLPDEVSVNLEALSESVNFEERPIVMVDPVTLQRVTEASVARQTLQFTYFSPHKQKTSKRMADVHLVHNHAGEWYAVSYDHEARDFRDFHIGRMSDIRETGIYFDRQKNWNKDEYLRRGFSMTRGGRLCRVSILFDQYQAQWMRERQKFHPDELREELPDGSLRISFKMGEAGLEAVARFCLQYAGHCVAESPKKLRSIIHNKLVETIAHYND